MPVILQRQTSSTTSTHLKRTLLLDSPSYMSGNLIEDGAAPRFSLNTSVGSGGPVTTIQSHSLPDSMPSFSPADSITSSEVGVVEWKAKTIGRPTTVVKVGGHNTHLKTLMKTTSFGSMRSFGIAGLDVKWIEKDGTWQCTSATETTSVLAVLHSRIATRGTRIEISNHGQNQMDNIVLTALFVLHGEQDWKAFQNRPTVVHSPYTFYNSRNQMFTSPLPHITALSLTLSSASFLDGLLAVGGQLMYAMKTTRNRTSISRYTWEETPRMEEFASIEWFGNGVLGKQKSMVTYKGRKECVDDFMYGSFLGNRMRRIGMPDFLPWLQWVERPPSWQCFSHPGKQPLAILERRFLSAGTKLDVTMEGLQYLDPLVISAILVVVGPLDWRRERTGNLQTGRANRSTGALIPRSLGGPSRTAESQRPAATGRSQSAYNVLEHMNGEPSFATPPGLVIIRRSVSERRLSGVSGESEIPEYSPPPRGLVVFYDDAPHNDPSPIISAMPSRANSPPPPATRAPHSLAPPSRHEGARIEEVTTPPPDYRP